jgi:polyphosphate kinase
MIGYTLDEFINIRVAELERRHQERIDPTFRSCLHCVEYKNHCKKLVRKLKTRKTGWACSDETKCESWRQS